MCSELASLQSPGEEVVLVKPIATRSSQYDISWSIGPHPQPLFVTLTYSATQQQGTNDNWLSLGLSQMHTFYLQAALLSYSTGWPHSAFPLMRLHRSSANLTETNSASSDSLLFRLARILRCHDYLRSRIHRRIGVMVKRCIFTRRSLLLPRSFRAHALFYPHRYPAVS